MQNKPELHALELSYIRNARKADLELMSTPNCMEIEMDSGVLVYAFSDTEHEISEWINILQEAQMQHRVARMEARGGGFRT